MSFHIIYDQDYNFNNMYDTPQIDMINMFYMTENDKYCYGMDDDYNDDDDN